jgi:succinyl-CoA synthetase beta subunit
MINILIMAGILVLLLCGAGMIVETYDIVKATKKETNDCR